MRIAPLSAFALFHHFVPSCLRAFVPVLALLLAAFTAGCPRRPLPERELPYFGPTEPMWQVVEAINANNQLVLGSAQTGWILDPPVSIPPEATNALPLLKHRLGSSLVAVYLHGSAVAKGLRKRSDVDLLVIVSKALPAPVGSVQTGTEYVAPRTAVETQLVRIWQEVLGLEHIGVQDNFFDLGGHSIKGMNLIQKIYTELGIEVPFNQVFRTPNIEKMAEELLKGKMAQEHDSIITKLNENGALNLFCFPPVVGYGAVFYELAKLLENHSVVYGLDYMDHHGHYEEMIHQYVDAIVRIQDQSPYVFLGYSSGGRLAFEVAKAMENRGYVVSDILIIDSMKKNEKTEPFPETMENEIDQLLDIVGDKYDLFQMTPLMRERIRQKMYAYMMYDHQLENTGKVRANIHSLVAEGKEARQVAPSNVLLWQDATLNAALEYEMIGEHTDVLTSRFVEKNATVIQLIVKKIIEEKKKQLQQL
jgi:thioesterase domain-containing protein/acyl carrier protein